MSPATRDRRSPVGPALPQQRTVRHVLPAALVLSAVVHAIILGLSFEVPVQPGRAVVATRVVASAVDPVMRGYDIVAVEGDAPSPAAVVVPIVPAIMPLRVQRRSGSATRPVDRDPPASIAELLAPAAGDPRLWERPGLPPPPAEPLDAVHGRLGNQLEPYNDSAAAAVQAVQRATDWTRRDARGGRWGISPARIHLGEVTLQLLPDTTEWVFRPPPGRREEQNARIRTFDETRLQVRRSEVERLFDVRVRALRERNAAKRDSSRTSGR